MLLTVTGNEFGEKATSKGGSMTGYYLRGTNEKGEAKEYFIPDFKISDNSALEAVKTLEVGQQAILTWVKDGANMALSSIALSTGGTPVGVSSKSAKAPSFSKGSFGKNDPATQISIQRQNALTNATNLYIAVMDKQDHSTPPILGGLVKNILEIANGLLAIHEEAK